VRRTTRAVLIVAITLVLASSAGALWLRHLLSPVKPEAPAISLTVARGVTLSALARTLADAGQVRSAFATEWLGRLGGHATQLQAGEYEISAAWSTGEILDHIARGRVKTYVTVLPEGLRATEIADRLASAELVDRDAFVRAVNDETLARSLGIEGATLEGYLFPETYRVPRDLPADKLAGLMVGQFRAVWLEIEPIARERGLSMREVVTLASIVEKETGAAEERPVIASVFLNRLEKGMRLETDPTVIYGIPDFDGNLKRVHLEDASNPYNTYRISGLPPGPIASPGADALRAVVEPAETEYLYFVSKNDGTHHFSRSYREHVKAVNRFQRRKRQ